jgi:hypothetical protein
MRVPARSRGDKVRRRVVMQRSIFVVVPDGDDHCSWNVIEETMARAITGFDDKDGAIDYATRLAKAEAAGRVDVRNESGSIEATLDFDSGEHDC